MDRFINLCLLTLEPECPQNTAPADGLVLRLFPRETRPLPDCQLKRHTAQDLSLAGPNV